MIWLALSAILQEVLYLILTHIGPAVEKDVGLLPQFLGLWTGTFLLFFASLVYVRKKQLPIPSSLAVILGAALVFRLTVFFLPLVLSNDLLYYIWYGRLQTHGFNPYMYAVHAPELAHLRDSIVWQAIPYKQIIPVYPAFIMEVFHLAHAIGGDSLLGFKALQFVPEAITCIAGIYLLKAYEKNPLGILLYAWCPLPIVEYLGMGHSDAWAVAMLTVFLLFWKRSEKMKSAVGLACGMLVKWLPILWLPLVFLRLDNKGRLKFFAIFFATILLFYLPYYSAKNQMIGLLPTFMKSYQFNGSIYQMFYELTKRGDISHLIVNILIVSGTLFITWRSKDWIRGLLGIFLVFFICSYQIFPWYLGYFLPLLLITDCWAVLAWLLTSIFSYQVLMPFLWSGNWVESPWILLAEYLPFYALLIAQGIYEKKFPLDGVRSRTGDLKIPMIPATGNGARE